VLTLAALAAACVAQPVQVGPLGQQESTSHLCVPIRGSAPVISADTVLDNHGKSRVTVESVKLIRPKGLTLKEAFLLPIANKTLPGTTSTAELSATWVDRIAAKGASVDAGQTRTLALLLDRGAKGSFDDIEVTYTASGHKYVLRQSFSLRLLAAEPCATGSS
jgi:hypothetical protein